MLGCCGLFFSVSFASVHSSLSSTEFLPGRRRPRCQNVLPVLDLSRAAAHWQAIESTALSVPDGVTGVSPSRADHCDSVSPGPRLRRPGPVRPGKRNVTQATDHAECTNDDEFPSTRDWQHPKAKRGKLEQDSEQRSLSQTLWHQKIRDQLLDRNSSMDLRFRTV